MKIFINYKQNSSPDHNFARTLEDQLKKAGHQVFRDETGVSPSEKWTVRLEREIRNCDTIISLLSNDALRSSWVLNEIDLAIKLEKRIVPLLLEEIEESLEFQAFRPRFGSIQWLRTTDNFIEDCKKIVNILHESRHECYRDLIANTLAKHGCDNGNEILEAMCSALYQLHWPTALHRALWDKQQDTTLNPSLSESLLEEISIWGNLLKQNGDLWRKDGEIERGKRMVWQSQRLLCLAEILSSLIDAWNRNLSRRELHSLKDNPNAHLMDDSDGESAFASEYADPMRERTSPVPKGSIVRVFSLNQLRGIENSAHDNIEGNPSQETQDE